MSETPKCPYCGDKMILHILPHKYHAPLTSAWYQCVTCDSASPRLEFPLSRATSATSNIEETTLAVTLRRVEPKKNHALTLEEVSQVADLSPTYLSTIFKKDTGMTFLEYLSKVRMDMAKKLLKETNDTVADICGKVGYSDVRYFTKSFTKYAGLKPKEYRKLYS